MADWLRNLAQRSNTPNLNPNGRDSSSSERPLLSPSRVRPSARRVASLLSLNSKDHKPSGSSHTSSSTFGSPEASVSSSGHSSTAKGSSKGSGKGSSKGSAANEPWAHTDLDQFEHGTPTISSQLSDPYGDGFPTAEAERVWAKPSIEDLIETLQVAMMTRKDALTPLPARFNSHILALLEGFRRKDEEIAQANQRTADVQALREKDMDEFGRLFAEWRAREEGFHAEIKRVELQMSDMEGGMAAVMLARSNSLVARGRVGSRRFAEKINRMSAGDSKIDEEGTEKAPTAPTTTGLTRTATCHKTIAEIPRLVDPDHDRRLSDQLRPPSPKPRHKHVKHRRPSMGAAQLDRIKTPEKKEEKRAAYRPKGGSPGPLEQSSADVEHLPHYDADNDLSSTSSSSSSVYMCDPSSSGSNDEATNDKNKGVAHPEPQHKQQPREPKNTDYFTRPRARALLQHRELPGDNRRFSFAVGEVDKLPMTPRPIVPAVPEGDASDERTDEDTSGRVHTHTEQWLKRQETVVYSPESKLNTTTLAGPQRTDFELDASRLSGLQKDDLSRSRNTAIRVGHQDWSSSPDFAVNTSRLAGSLQTDFELTPTRLADLQKTDSSSSRNTAVKVGQQECSTSPMAVPQDWWSSDDAETEKFRAELQGARLDAMSGFGLNATTGLSGLEKNDSSSSRNTVIRTSQQERSSSPMRALKDSLRDASETEKFKAELQSARLDSMSANDMRNLVRLRAEQKEQKNQIAKDGPSHVSGRGSRHPSYNTEATYGTELGTSGLLRGGPMASKLGPSASQANVPEDKAQSELEIPKAREAVRLVTPTPSIQRGRPSASGSAASRGRGRGHGRGRGRSPITGHDNRAFTPNRPPGPPTTRTNRLPSYSTNPTRTPSGGTTRGGPTSPPGPVSPPGGSGGGPAPSNDARSAAQIAAQMAVARGIRRTPGSGDSRGPGS